MSEVSCTTVARCVQAIELHYSVQGVRGVQAIELQYRCPGCPMCPGYIAALQVSRLYSCTTGVQSARGVQAIELQYRCAGCPRCPGYRAALQVSRMSEVSSCTTSVQLVWCRDYRQVALYKGTDNSFWWM